MRYNAQQQCNTVRYNAQPLTHVQFRQRGTQEEMQKHQQQVAQQLKLHRKKRGWSLDRTAAETGVSKAMLGQIERGESSPTVATLWKIATGLHVALSSLIAEPPEKTDLFNISSKHRMPLESSKAPLEPLFPYDPTTGIELFVIDLAPGQTYLSSAHDEGVTEHIIVISGSMEILLNAQWHSLAKGQAMRFDGNQAHGYRNLGSKKSCFHSLIHYQNTRGD